MKKIEVNMSLEKSIAEILKTRKERLSLVENRIKNINGINTGIRELEAALKNILKHPKVTDDIKSNFNEFQSASDSWKKEITATLDRLANVQNRLEREGITIGCSGEARVGKSTLLRTIGNLPENAIPTGKGLPVTAVRSRIRHSQESKATLSLRDKTNFINELIKPFHVKLNLPQVNSFEDFRNFNYNNPELEKDTNKSFLERLKKMQSALNSDESYEDYLTGKTKIIDNLNELRPWVAYPTEEEENNQNCSRLYLAVKEVDIQCNFLVDVEKLMLIDLPGLGEVNVNAKEDHLEGLKNQVDLVLLILRPTEVTAYWGDRPQEALELIQDSNKRISELGDFVIIVVNCGEQDDPELNQKLINDVHRKLNNSEPNSNYQVLNCDAKNSDNVREELLVPALNHLIERLPKMDKEIIDSSLTQWQQTVEKITTSISDLEKSLQKFPSKKNQGSTSFIAQKAEQLRRQLATKIEHEVLDRLKEEVEQEKENNTIIDKDLIKEIDNKHQEIKNWAEKDYLGKDKDTWEADADDIFLNKKVGGFATDEINRSRTFLTNTYSELDIYFNNKIEELFQRISQVISDCTGNLIKDVTPGKDALEKFLDLLGDSGIGDPFPSLREATEYLLKCSNENSIFQSHLLPKLVNETQKLTPEAVDFNKFSYKDPEVKKKVLKEISERVVETSNNVQKELKNNPFIAIISYSAAVKFEDSLLRDKNAEHQFLEFATSYKNEIWSEEFQMIERDSHTIKKVEQGINNIKELLKQNL